MDKIEIITDSVSIDRLKESAKEGFGDMVKAVVDIERKIMALAGELHADEEAVLLHDGSKQENLWGINIYVNLSNTVEDPDIQKKLKEIVNSLVK